MYVSHSGQVRRTAPGETVAPGDAVRFAVTAPTDIHVARFFVYALLGADHDSSPYTQTGERIARIAAGGIRLVIDELRSDGTKTRKDGTRGRLRYDYGDHRDPQAAIAWLWKSSTPPRPRASSTAAPWSF